jgi:hypothetical protein
MIRSASKEACLTYKRTGTPRELFVGGEWGKLICLKCLNMMNWVSGARTTPMNTAVIFSTSTGNDWWSGIAEYLLWMIQHHNYYHKFDL